MDLFTMVRRGSLVPHTFTPNQCKQEGHGKYFYEVRIIFSCSVPLDENRFIIEHSELDRAIKECSAVGSCEQMHFEIRDRIHTFFKVKDIWGYVRGFKCTIYPTLSDINEGAFMSCTYVQAGYPEVLGLLR